MRFATSMTGKRAADAIEDAIEDGIENAVDDEVKTSLTHNAVTVAQSRIEEAGAVFRGDLIESFEVDEDRTNGVWHVTIENTSDHAAPIEYGAEYEEEGPPVVALIPWVKAKMSGFDVPEPEIESMPEPDRIRERASENVSYGIDVSSLASDAVVEKAFFLQQHIKEEGIDALYYMQHAQEWVEDRGDSSVAMHITSELRGL